MKGKLIVIDGTDGSGKATQVALLVKRFRKMRYKVKVEDFPRYGKKSAGLVEEYLNGKYGSAEQLGPYIPSMFYALDRFAASFNIKDALEKGYIVISNRYVTANMGHQGGKVKSPRERNKFFKWAEDLEYNFFKIPRPDLTLILHMSIRISLQLVDIKGIRKDYTKRKRDLHTRDTGHMRNAEKAYLELAGKFGYPVIECYEKGRVLSRNEIADKIWQITKSKLKV